MNIRKVDQNQRPLANSWLCLLKLYFQLNLICCPSEVLRIRCKGSHTNPLQSRDLASPSHSLTVLLAVFYWKTLFYHSFLTNSSICFIYCIIDNVNISKLPWNHHPALHSFSSSFCTFLSYIFIQSHPLYIFVPIINWVVQKIYKKRICFKIHLAESSIRHLKFMQIPSGAKVTQCRIQKMPTFNIERYIILQIKGHTHKHTPYKETNYYEYEPE